MVRTDLEKRVIQIDETGWIVNFIFLMDATAI